jgi:hypothetical protein
MTDESAVITLHTFQLYLTASLSVQLTFFALFVSFLIRYWHHIYPGKAPENPHTPARPVELYILLAILPLQAILSSTPLVYALHLSRPIGLRGVDADDRWSCAVFVFALVAIVLEDRSFHTHILRPYARLSRPDTDIKDKSLDQHAQAHLHHLDRRCKPACTLLCRWVALMHWPMPLALPTLTAQNVVTRYRIRAMCQTVPALTFLSMAGTFWVAAFLEGEGFGSLLDSTRSRGFVSGLAGAVYMLWAAILTGRGELFARRERVRAREETVKV